MLDSYDLGILECLAYNCRLPDSTIAEALGVSANTVKNRTLILERDGYIRQYVTIFDLRVLGFQRHHVMLRFSGRGRDMNSICKALAGAPSAMWIVSYIGSFDVQVLLDSHEVMPLNKILDDLFSRCGPELKDYALFSDQTDLEFTHCLPSFTQNPRLKLKDDGSFSPLLCKRSFPLPREAKRLDYTPFDLTLVQLISENPRASISDVASKLKVERQTARKHLERLIDAGLIINFGAGFDHQKLGFTAYHVLFRLQPGTSSEVIASAFRGVKGVFYAGTAHGTYDLHAYFYTQSPQDLSRLMQNIKQTFGAQILQTDLLVYDLVHYWRLFSAHKFKLLAEGRVQT